jgi:type IV secretory pathway component VirB8
MRIQSFYANKYHDEHIGSDHQRFMYGNLQSYQESVNSYNLSYIIDKIKHNKTLKLLVGILGAIIMATIIVLVIILIPLISKLINFIGQNGIQGVLDSISSLLDRILKGTGK